MLKIEKNNNSKNKTNNNKNNKNSKRNSQRQKKHKKETHSIFPKDFSHVFYLFPYQKLLGTIHLGY